MIPKATWPAAINAVGARVTYTGGGPASRVTSFPSRARARAPCSVLLSGTGVRISKECRK